MLQKIAFKVWKVPRMSKRRIFNKNLISRDEFNPILNLISSSLALLQVSAGELDLMEWERRRKKKRQVRLIRTYLLRLSECIFTRYFRSFHLLLLAAQYAGLSRLSLER